MYLKSTPYNYISRKASSNLGIRYRILELIWLNYFRQKITKKECGGKKECFSLIFERRVIHTFVCAKRKGKLKIKA